MTTSCRNGPDRQHFAHYYEEGVPRDERNAIAGHLATCPDCEAAYREYVQEREAYEAGEPGPRHGDESLPSPSNYGVIMPETELYELIYSRRSKKRRRLKAPRHWSVLRHLNPGYGNESSDFVGDIYEVPATEAGKKPQFRAKAEVFDPSSDGTSLVDLGLFPSVKSARRAIAAAVNWE